MEVEPSEEMVFATSDFADAFAPQVWEANTSESTHELLVHQKIEELVSQLNFSAFAVEPYSVEQITLKSEVEHSEDSANLESLSSDSESRAPAQASDFFNLESLLYDDDRDLLVIEEDIAKVVPTAISDEVQARTRTAAPYAQLFAKLRK